MYSQSIKREKEEEGERIKIYEKKKLPKLKKLETNWKYLKIIIKLKITPKIIKENYEQEDKSKKT